LLSPKKLVNWQRIKGISKLYKAIFTDCGKMLMIKVKFFKTPMFGKLALKFIHTSAKHINSSEIQVVLKRL
jgi:uncharacterized protein YaaW (UPF0174 family)